MKSDRTIMKKNDMILLAVLLMAAALAGAGYHFSHRAPALQAEITVDGKVVEMLDLSKNQEIIIHGVQDGTNTLIVQDGEIWCSDASCPDKVCIHQGKQSMDGGTIVCLPNRMIVRVIGEK